MGEPRLAPGRVVVLNGTSRSGKTTLTAGFIARRSLLGEPWVSFSIDEFLGKLPPTFIGADRFPPALADAWAAIDSFGRYSDQGFRLEATGPDTARLALGPRGRAVLELQHATVAAAARAGFDVVVDEAVPDQQLWDHWHEALAGLEVTWVCIECADAPRREAELGDRSPGMAKGMAAVVHTFGDHDVTIDTAALGADEAVDELIRLLGLD